MQRLRARVRYRSLLFFRLAASAVAWLNRWRGMFEIDFVTPSRFTANNCVGHLRSYERLKG